jgi:hypothetical protein
VITTVILAMCRDGKPRAFMTFKQVEYLVHWIYQMELVPAKQHIPIPSSKSLLFEEDLEEIVSHTLKPYTVS